MGGKGKAGGGKLQRLCRSRRQQTRAGGADRSGRAAAPIRTARARGRRRPRRGPSLQARRAGARGQGEPLAERAAVVARRLAPAAQPEPRAHRGRVGAVGALPREPRADAAADA